jgi:hypothetical protein
MNRLTLDAGFRDLGDIRTLFPNFQLSSLNMGRRHERTRCGGVDLGSFLGGLD